jgi:hypothetical protein
MYNAMNSYKPLTQVPPVGVYEVLLQHKAGIVFTATIRDGAIYLFDQQNMSDDLDLGPHLFTFNGWRFVNDLPPFHPITDLPTNADNCAVLFQLENGRVVTGRIQGREPFIVDQQNDRFIEHQWADGIVGWQLLPV